MTSYRAARDTQGKCTKDCLFFFVVLITKAFMREAMVGSLPSPHPGICGISLWWGAWGFCSALIQLHTVSWAQQPSHSFSPSSSFWVSFPNITKGLQNDRDPRHTHSGWDISITVPQNPGIPMPLSDTEQASVSVNCHVSTWTAAFHSLLFLYL